tara:strand:+ start:168 stop:404 length:237 start_codon:yes stop_codon:yes gene_type:complete
MADNETIDQVNPEAEVVDIVSAISDNQRAKAIDAIQDLLYAKSSDALGNYKQTVAKTYFDQPDEKPEEASNETDNGTD